MTEGQAPQGQGQAPAQQQQPPNGQAPSGDQQAGQESVLDQQLPEQDAFPRTYVEQLRSEAAKHRTTAKELETVINQYGGRELAENRLRAFTTPQGVMQLFLEAGRSFGTSNEELEQFIMGDPNGPAGGGQEPDPDADRPLTKKEIIDILSEYVTKEVKQPLSQQREQDLVNTGKQVIFKTLDDLQITDEKVREWIITRAEKYAPEGPNMWDPEAISEAVRQGHKDFEQLIEEQAKAYLGRKEQVDGLSVGLPASNNGGGWQLPEEPKDAAHASAIMRKLLSRSE